eukprot:TRINITY_DN28215_c0_g1_i1.p1 TRINITY_DN28215_c0_g1~~TRINITY_DN28215_c0_g1_i1.p1  ORF type:complete len:329 (-),score=67.84 TRINITY_DN28215_c0_g1_i1:569-1555(-)
MPRSTGHAAKWYAAFPACCGFLLLDAGLRNSRKDAQALALVPQLMELSKNGRTADRWRTDLERQTRVRLKARPSRRKRKRRIATVDAPAEDASAWTDKTMQRWPLGEDFPYIIEARSLAEECHTWSDDGLQHEGEDGTHEIDPFGCVSWPGCAALASVMQSSSQQQLPLTDGRVLELGAGTGFCSLVAASSGAAAVTATDTNPTVLRFLEQAAAEQQLQMSTMIFDLCGESPLPAGIDVLLAADVCYNKQLAAALARRCHEISRRGSMFAVADSVNIARSTFEAELDRRRVPFVKSEMDQSFVGHAVAVDEEIEYTASVSIYLAAPRG